MKPCLPSFCRALALAAPLLGLVACSDADERDNDTQRAPAPPLESSEAPACGPGGCALKSGERFDGEPGAGLVTVPFAAEQNLSRGGGVLSDIISHLPAEYGNTYYDDDPITHGHETSHGIHAHIRNTMNDTGGSANGFYVLENRAVIVAEPNLRKSQVAAYVPQSLRGSRFGMYVTGQVEWDDTPLYLWDEWNAYVNGGATGVDMVQGGLWDRGWRDGVAGQLEFTVYAIAVAMAVEVHDPNYLRDHKQFREFLAWNTRRSMEIFRAGKDLEDFRWDTQDAYLASMRTSPDAEAFRAFCRDFFGQGWADAVLFGDGAVPDAPDGPVDPIVPDGPVEPDEPDGPVGPDGPEDPEGPELDGDSDGVIDSQDLCSQTPLGARIWNSGDWLGCGGGQIRDQDRRVIDGPDLDVDGIGDATDLCGATPAGMRVWRSGDWLGCAEGQRRDVFVPGPGEDLDVDGIGDAQDLCQATQAGARVWRSGEWAGCAEGQRRD